MEIITKQLKDIKPYEKNPRKNDEAYGISRGSVWQIRKGITYARA